MAETERPLILVVEDNLTNARLTGAMLEAAQYRVAYATDGEQGFELAKQLQPALIVTDLQMPGVDGLALLRLLSAEPATQSIPAVVLTAHVMPEHRDRAAAAACRRFIAKPVRYHSFIEEIAQVLAESLTGASHDHQ